jgi:hypothetical protein
MTCSYDAQGRLTEARTGSENSEFAIIETYEYGPRFIRRRTNSSPGGRSVTTQTLDIEGRVIKEVVLDEATSKVQRTIETTYQGNRKDVCEASVLQHRQCATTVHDSHGNEIEYVAEGESRKTSIDYDSIGNWISKRTTVTMPLGGKAETIVRRKIEYW